MKGVQHQCLAQPDFFRQGLLNSYSPDTAPSEGCSSEKLDWLASKAAGPSAAILPGVGIMGPVLKWALMGQARALLLVQQALCQLSHFPQLTSPPPPFYLYAQCQIVEMGKKREWFVTVLWRSKPPEKAYPWRLVSYLPLEVWPMLKEALRWKQFHFSINQRIPALSGIKRIIPKWNPKKLVTSGYTPQINQLCPRAAVSLMRLCHADRPCAFQPERLRIPWSPTVASCLDCRGYLGKPSWRSWRES